MEATAPQFPPVVAVLVTADPGPWFEATLTALAAEDYPGLSVLVIDDASAVDPTPRVAAVLPHAYVRRRTARGGFAVAANEALDLVEGATHFLFCHDDVVLERGSIRTLLEESYRSNAGIVGPKLVDWEDAHLLLQVGVTCDKFGTPSHGERGELDQEQHDAVREVFSIPGACQLVRADLMRALGGFDPAMTMFVEDLDLCWRAQVAGARVVVVPDAVARHREATSGGHRPLSSHEATASGALSARELERRHRIRAVFKNYSRFHLLRVVPQLALVNLFEIVHALGGGRRADSRAIASAWRWNLGHLSDIRRARRTLGKQRQVPDGEIRRLQVSGSARLTNFIRGELGRSDRSLAATREALAAPLRGSRALISAWTALAVILAVGSRSLVGARLPSIGQLGAFPSAFSFLGHFVGGWRATGLGSAAPAPTAFGLLGMAGVVLFGATAQLQKLLVLGALPLGLLGVFRSTRPFESRRARLASVAAYAAIPLPYDAIGRGRLSAAIAYAAAPWVHSALLRAAAVVPFGLRSAPDADAAAPGRWVPVVRIGLFLAVLGALVPSLPLVAVLASVGLVLGAVVASGRASGELRGLATAAGAVVVAAVLLLPWTLDLVLPGASLDSVTGPASPFSRGLHLADVLRFHTGPVGGGPLGFALMAAALLPLLLGHGWRLSAAVRCWVVALLVFAVTWAGGRGWLGIHVVPADVTLTMAAVSLALAVGLGVTAFERDVTGHRLGWRQGVSLAAAGALGLSLLPVAAASIDGRWGLPEHDFGSLLVPTPADRASRQFRILWVGDPAALPLASWRLSDGVAFATSTSARPDALSMLPPSDNGATGLLADSVNLARSGLTSRLGHLLAPMAVRYVVVPRSMAPDGEHTPLLDPPPDVPAALAAQTDLQVIEGDVNLLVYENSAWAPQRAVLGPAALKSAARAGLLEATSALDAKTALPRRQGEAAFGGPVRRGEHVFFSATANDGWQLRVGGHGASHRRDFGWANGFSISRTGDASLVFVTPISRRLGALGQVILWVAAVGFLWRRRHPVTS